MAKVLVVDDEPTIRDMLAQMLALEGYTPITAADGRQALEVVRQTPPDVIVLDLMMPVMDGWTFAQQCHVDPMGHGIPIIVLSASSRAKSAQEDLAGTGVCAVLPKPFRMDALIAVIAANVRR